MTLVLDNSVAMRWCLGDGSPQDLAYAAAVARRLQTDTAIVPAIWPLEVVNVLARAEFHAQLETDTSNAFLATLREMRIVIDADTDRYAFTATMDLARHHHLSAYDSAYLELALRMHFPLATLDVDLRQAATRAGAEIFA